MRSEVTKDFITRTRCLVSVRGPVDNGGPAGQHGLSQASRDTTVTPLTLTPASARFSSLRPYAAPQLLSLALKGISTGAFGKVFENANLTTPLFHLKPLEVPHCLLLDSSHSPPLCPRPDHTPFLRLQLSFRHCPSVQFRAVPGLDPQAGRPLRPLLLPLPLSDHTHLPVSA